MLSVAPVACVLFAAAYFALVSFLALVAVFSGCRHRRKAALKLVRLLTHRRAPGAR